eukprot:10308609-Alexandrium_andersonii.AAC.1
MSQGHLLALARYARLTNDQTQRRLMALDAYWTAATDTGGTASAPPRSGGEPPLPPPSTPRRGTASSAS